MCIVTVYWILLFPEFNKDMPPGGVQGLDLFFPLLAHAILPGFFFIEYMISRVPIDSSGLYWYFYGAVSVAYLVTNIVITTIWNKPVYSVMSWFTGTSSGLAWSFAYAFGMIAYGIIQLFKLQVQT